MTKLLLAAALAGAALVPAAPAQAGQCGGKLDVACTMGACSPDYPCTPQICLVYSTPRCVV